MVRMHSNDRENTDHAEAGDIIAMVGVDFLTFQTCEAFTTKLALIHCFQ